MFIGFLYLAFIILQFVIGHLIFEIEEGPTEKHLPYVIEDVGQKIAIVIVLSVHSLLVGLLIYKEHVRKLSSHTFTTELPIDEEVGNQ